MIFPQLYLMQLFYEIHLVRMTLLQQASVGGGGETSEKKYTHTHKKSKGIFLGNEEMGRRDALMRAYMPTTTTNDGSPPPSPNKTRSPSSSAAQSVAGRRRGQISWPFLL